MNKTVIAIRDLRAQLQALEKRIGSGAEDAKSLVAASADVRKKISAIEEELVQVNSKSSEDQANYPTMLNSKLGHLQSLIDSADTAPTAAEDAVFAELDQRLEIQLTTWSEVLAKDLARAQRSPCAKTTSQQSPQRRRPAVNYPVGARLACPSRNHHDRPSSYFSELVFLRNNSAEQLISPETHFPIVFPPMRQMIQRLSYPSDPNAKASRTPLHSKIAA